MGFATVIAVCLFAQAGDTADYSINQWESHLLEWRWGLVDDRSECPRLLLVLKCHTPDHRVFELYMYDMYDIHHDIDELGGHRPWRTVRAWTGTYKMQARENHDRSISERLVQLNVDRYWLPVEPFKLCQLRRRADEHGLVVWRCDLHPADWPEELGLLHWREVRDFKPFLAELKVDLPTAPDPPESIRFLLRSNDVMRVGWWTIGTEYVLSPVWKWRRSLLPFE